MNEKSSVAESSVQDNFVDDFESIDTQSNATARAVPRQQGIIKVGGPPRKPNKNMIGRSIQI